MNMVKVKVEVADGTAAFTAVVHAERIQQAVQIAKNQYPESAVRVVFPIDPEGFFVKEIPARAELAGPESLEAIAAV